MRLVCDRCLEQYEWPVAEELCVLYNPLEEHQSREDLTAEDLDEEYYDGEEIDLWPAVREALVLSLPIKGCLPRRLPGPVPGMRRKFEPGRLRLPKAGRSSGDVCSG